ncbi:MAG TPA: serine hydrolase [Thermoleophilia bacterium]|nr:serine hydrolase [Thermoleophilia bacterium]
MRSRALLLTLLMVLTLCALAAPALAGSDAQVVDENPALTARLQAIVDDPVYTLPGLVVLTMQGGEVTYTGNLGHRYIDGVDPANSLPVDEYSMFRIASISKLVAAVGIMQQVEAGNIDLDADVSTYLGFTLRNPHFPDVPITCRHLMSHTSSIRDGSTYSRPLDVPLSAAFFPPSDYYTGARWESAHPTIDKSPGKYFTYANLNYGVLATVLENVTGELFATYMNDHVLDPMGIDGGYVPALFGQWEIENVGVLYRQEDGAWAPQVDDYQGVIPDPPAGFDVYVPGFNATWQSPQGGLRISTWDLAKVMKMFINGGTYEGTQILEPETVELMFTPYWTYDPALDNGDTYYDLMMSYGLGPHIMTNTAGDRILADWDIFMSGHLGEAYGLWSGFMFDDETGDGFIYYVTGRWGPAEFGEYSTFYLTEERVMTALFEEQLLPVDDWSGMLPPVKADGSSVFRIGRAVPLRFRLYDECGDPVAGMTPILSLARLCDGEWGEEFKPRSKTPPKTSDVFRYRAGTYVYNLDTKGLTAGTYRARIAIGAGAQLYAEFSLR